MNTSLDDLQAYVIAYQSYMETRRRATICGGEWCRTARQIVGLSVRKMATTLDVSPSYLSKMERGLEPISPELAQKLLDWTKEKG